MALIDGEEIRLRPKAWPPPWWIWVFLAPAVFIPLQKLWIGPGERVDVLGAGRIHGLLVAEAPEGVRFEGEAPIAEGEVRERVKALRAQLRVRCRTLERALCVDLDGASPEEAEARLQHAAQRAVARLHALQATTRRR